MPLSKIEIIHETIEFYAADIKRRAFTDCRHGASCQYHTNDDRQCAVGRCLIDSSQTPSGGVCTVWGSDEDLDADLKPEYRGHDRNFWQVVQRLHDNSDNWTNNGLTLCGLQQANDLVRRYLSEVVTA